MDLSNTHSVTIKMEPGIQEGDEDETPYADTDMNPPDIKKIYLEYTKSIDPLADVGVIKSEPETLLEEDNLAPHWDAELLYPPIRQETEDASAVKCEPAVLAAEEHAQEYGGYSERDIEYTVTKKECFVLLERIDQNRESVFPKMANFSNSQPSIIAIRHTKTKQLRTEKKSFSCPTCTYSCSRKSRLVVHIRTHSGEKPFSCSECSFRCRYKGNLVNHIKTHPGERPLSCSECSFRCIKKGDMIKHEIFHNAGKPFSCSICTYKFIRKSDFLSHIKIHDAEKPFSCTVCSFRCIEKHHLIIHERTHTGEKPFSCLECSFRCSNQRDLHRHTRTHTGEIPFSRSVCTNRSGRKTWL